MKVSELILKNKHKILPELYIWVETFNPEEITYNDNILDENEEEEMYKSYEYMLNLVERFENNQCNKDDYENILFHIDQINYNEPKINL